MEKRMVNQIGIKPIYIEKNDGEIYIGENHYVEEPSSAFCNGSYELLDYTPTIEPAILRDEVGYILEWIERTAPKEKSARLALLYGKAGIGKSIVMHDLLEKLQSKDDYLVLGLKSDQIEFVDTDELSHKIHLAQPIEIVVKEMAKQYKRVVLLIDQIDALSLSLSSNRTPLRSLLKVISQVQSVHNVRIVISCRPYDLEFDPLLDNLKIKNKWELKELTKEQVLQTLKENQRNERLSDNLLRFLGNPLHLYLFLKISSYNQLTDPLSTDLLYHQLWSKYVNNDSVRKVDKEKLLSLLDYLVTTMYRRQELSVHIRELETKHNAELSYLFTNGLLIITKHGQVQFFHQTLFDYVYARRFTEKGENLLEELKRQHQGLFYRLAVKSILLFKREQSPWEYIHILEQLLYAKNEDNQYTFRFHLKSLALSNLAYFESPLQEELHLISRKIYSDKVYMDVIFESVYTSNWFNAIWAIIDSKGGWKRLSKEYKEKTIVMCQRTLLLAAEIVIDKLDAVLDYGDENDCKYMGQILQCYDLKCGSDKLINIYNKLVKNRDSLEYTHLLNNILNENPIFVCEELKENVRSQMKKRERYVNKISISHDVAHLYQELLKNHHSMAIRLLVDILNIFYESTLVKIEGKDIYSSTDYLRFQRTSGGHFGSDFIEDVVNTLIDDFLNNIEEERTKHYIAECSKSKYEGVVFIALYIYSSHPRLFKDEVYEILMKRQVLSNAPCWVEYQAVEALKMVFPLMNDEQKTNIIDRILAIEDKREYVLLRMNPQIRLQYGHPLLNVDLQKGKILEVIAKEELRRLSWTAYQERQRIDRKYNKERLKNEKPSSVSSHIGWSSLREDQGIRMSPEAWHTSMLKYTKEPVGWDKPSLRGQCHLFRNVVGKEPERFIRLINQLIQDDKILLAYPLAGMQGLMDANRLDEAMRVLDGILKVIDNDVNSTIRGFSLHSLLFALNDIVKHNPVPEIVVRLLCNALINAKEPEEDEHQEDKDIYNVGINQARGNAGCMLVECACDDGYKEDIFSAIESVAETASVYTRAAILLNMAMLNFHDMNRNVFLYKKLMHDYDPRLMAMPVHEYNPLVYFINYAIDDVIDILRHAADCPECYREQVVILWLAWSHNDRDERIKVLLDKMCDTSQVARLSLLNVLSSLDEKINDDAIYYILHLMSPQFDSPEMGEAFDNLFFHINKLPEEIQCRITDAYVNSPLCKHEIKTFIGFLGGCAIKDPVQTLKWLDQILNAEIPDDYFICNNIVDIIIQSYNGIKSYNDNCYQETLEYAMDMIDAIMQNPRNKYLISNFINKLDNE